MPEHALMVGDDYQADVVGAQKVGMNAIHVNREKPWHNASKEIQIRNIGDLVNHV